MIVVDTNVIAYLLLESEQTASTEVVAHKDPDWVAPHLWRSEFRNVLVLNMRQARIEPDDALRLIAKAESLMAGKDMLVSSLDVLRLANQSQCSAYDREFVVLAQDLNVPLVTADQRMLREFPNVAVSLHDFATQA